jgi:small conductance mechanosensitive channel
VVIRCRFRTQPLEHWGVKREYLRREKAAFHEHGIEIPYALMTEYSGQDREGNAPAFALQQLTEA